MEKYTKNAFTLTEILIILGIIGIVATMTIPTLINKINDYENIIKWRKEYSVISNIFNSAVSENITVCSKYYHWGACVEYHDGFNEPLSTELDNYFRNHLSIVDSCGLENRHYEGNKYCDGDPRKRKKNFPWVGTFNLYSIYSPLGT